MLDLNEFCNTFSWGEKEKQFLAPYWEELCANTTDEFPFFMEEAVYKEYSEKAHVSSDVYPRMAQVAQTVRKNQALCRLANMWHYAYFKAANPIYLRHLPPENKFFGENSGVFQLLIALSSIPGTAKNFAALGLEEKYHYANAPWIGGTVSIYAAAHDGIPGHTTTQTYWLRMGMDGKIFRIGRFEYMLKPWKEELGAVYVNRSDRTLQVLCRDQAKYDKDLCLITENSPEQAVYFTARLKVLDNHVTGTPVAPDGKPRTGRKVTLDLAQWEPLVAPWDVVADIHIPGGGSMSMDAVKESMKEARAFFRKYFSVDVKAFVCSSWILNPVWQKELPSSNLAKFQKNCYLTSVIKAKTAGLFFVYGKDEGDPRQWQKTSSLHEAFCRIFDRNESLAYASMFIPAADLDHFGTEYYLNNYSL